MLVGQAQSPGSAVWFEALFVVGVSTPAHTIVKIRGNLSRLFTVTLLPSSEDEHG
jgi:hypothetical protein